MPECPKCGCEVVKDAEKCPQCDCILADATASFEPVGDERAAEDKPALVVDGPVLVVRKGPQPGERFYLERPSLTVGRDPESDIFLNDMTVSRSHAIFEQVGDEVSVRDAGSLNGTYVNGVCVDSAILSNGDVVQIGTFQMLYLTGGELS